ncbi:MAG: hypothetical protein GXY15_03835 [Candidatus Hydrogenedentes bacterium]|nr:hypothetical protein [Candidatus Hydrogenedentota bacterium]
METVLDTRPPEEVASPGGGVSLAALQDTALAGLGLVFVTKGWMPLMQGMAQMAHSLSGDPSLPSPLMLLQMRASAAGMMGEGVLLAAVGVFLVLRARAVARNLWGDGAEAASALTPANALMHLASLIALYRMVSLLVKLPGEVWFTVSLAMSEDTGPMLHDGGEGLFRSLFVILVCLVCLAKARPLGAWMARRAGLAD